jgi:hypothetical protein
MVDTVAVVGDLFEGIYLPANFRSIIRFVSSILRMRRTLSTWVDVGELYTHSENDEYANGEDFVDAFWQTLATGNVSEDRNISELRQSHENCKNNWVLKMLGLSFVMTFFIASVMPVVSRVFGHPGVDVLTQLRYLLFRRMIRTEQERYIGLVSGDVKQGDEVWLLEGSKVPLIIRRRTEGYGRFIGDAYVHGIMYGEAFKSDNCQDLMLE